MNIPKPEGLLSSVLPDPEISSSASSQQLFISQDQQEEETSDCPLLTPSPTLLQIHNLSLETMPMFNPIEGTPSPPSDTINPEDGLNAFINIVNSSSKPLVDEPSSRDPMVESTSSSSSSDINEPVCTQLLTQLNTAYQHLAPDAQALFSNQENGGKPPLVGIQLVVPKPPRNYDFMKWNWPLIRKVWFWSMISVFVGCAALVIGIIATMPRKCDPSVRWWQGGLFYEIFPASFQDSPKNADGIGDVRGITMRLDYIKKLGVRGIRLNSIFPATYYPEYYTNVTSLDGLNPYLGSLQDFSILIRETHKRNMSLILDLPLYPLIKTFNNENLPKSNDDIIETLDPKLSHPNTLRTIMDGLSTVDREEEDRANQSRSENLISSAMKKWLDMGIDGFYLKGLEHFVKEDRFAINLRYWKSLMGPDRILICHLDTLKAADSIVAAKNTILTRIDMIDVTLRVDKGTEDLRVQINSAIKGILYEKPSYPWIHWSIGNVDSKRLASILGMRNTSITLSILEMMLPGTPSIFYGDEKGLMDCDCKDHLDLGHVHNLVPMYWEDADGLSNKFVSEGIRSWLPSAEPPLKTELIGTVAAMAKLRTEVTSIYVNAVLKHKQIVANCDVRYAKDDIIIIERWYPRRNSYVLVANLGSETTIKDLSSLYYRGQIVVGAPRRLNQDVYFKKLVIFPGEAFVIKLDK